MSPKRSMICSQKSYKWMEQEIMDEIEPSQFRKSLEVIEEQSMEINEEKEE